MYLHIASVLGDADFRLIQRVYADPAAFEDGQRTAGRQAAAVKRNEQAKPAGLAAEVIRLVEKRLMKHELFVAAARPKSIIRILLSRYRPGMGYGLHVDEPMMDKQRTDLSFTLFLSPPEDYEGGELVIEEPGGERPIKLGAGDLVLYPSGSLHRVAPVTGGERRTAVGWVRSQVRDPAAREVLFDLAVLRQQAVQAESRAMVDRLDKVAGALMRRWAED